MTEHTKEPWFCGLLVKREIIADNYPVAFARLEGRPIEEAQANARRIVACVNALAGIENPAAFVAAFERMQEALEMAHNAVGDLKRGWAGGVSPERWVDQVQTVTGQALTASRQARGGEA